MPQNKTNISLLSPLQKKMAIDQIIGFFETERGEKIGMIAAEEVLDMFLENIAKTIYNKGVSDCQKMIKDQLEELTFQMETVKKE